MGIFHIILTFLFSDYASMINVDAGKESESFMREKSRMWWKTSNCFHMNAFRLIQWISNVKYKLIQEP